MKKISINTGLFILAIMVYHFQALGQNIFDITGTDPQWILAYPSKNVRTKVTIEKAVSKNEIMNAGYNEYYVYRGKVVYDYFEKKDTIYSTKDYPMECFPLYIKTRNNNFQLCNDLGDSIVINTKGNVSRVFQGYLRNDENRNLNSVEQGEIHLRYLNDTTIIEFFFTEAHRITPQISVVFLDAFQNIKLVYQEVWSDEGSDSLFHDSIFKGTRSISEINNWYGTEFHYDKSKRQILKIQTIRCTNGKKVPEYNQYFTYYNGKPVSSYIFDELKKKKIAVQKYVYKSVNAIPGEPN